MKRYLALGCFGVGLIVSPVLGGIVHAAVPANPKIGIVNLQETLESTPAGKRATESLDRGRKAKQAQIDKQQDELKKEGAELERQKGVLGTAAYDGKRQSLEKKVVELQQSYVKLERELMQDRSKVLGDLMKQAEPKLSAIARAEGVTVVFDKAAVVWSEPAVDLTAKLNAQMN